MHDKYTSAIAAYQASLRRFADVRDRAGHLQQRVAQARAAALAAQAHFDAVLSDLEDWHLPHAVGEEERLQQ